MPELDAADLGALRRGGCSCRRRLASVPLRRATIATPARPAFQLVHRSAVQAPRPQRRPRGEGLRRDRCLGAFGRLRRRGGRGSRCAPPSAAALPPARRLSSATASAPTPPANAISAPMVGVVRSFFAAIVGRCGSALPAVAVAAGAAVSAGAARRARRDRASGPHRAGSPPTARSGRACSGRQPALTPGRRPASRG